MTGIAERVLQSSVRAQARSTVSVMMNLVEEVGNWHEHLIVLIAVMNQQLQRSLTCSTVQST